MRALQVALAMPGVAVQLTAFVEREKDLAARWACSREPPALPKAKSRLEQLEGHRRDRVDPPPRGVSTGERKARGRTLDPDLRPCLGLVELPLKVLDGLLECLMGVQSAALGQIRRPGTVNDSPG